MFIETHEVYLLVLSRPIYWQQNISFFKEVFWICSVVEILIFMVLPAIITVSLFPKWVAQKSKTFDLSKT